MEHIGESSKEYMGLQTPVHGVFDWSTSKRETVYYIKHLVVIVHDQNRKSHPSHSRTLVQLPFVVEISIVPHFIRFQNFLEHNFCGHVTYKFSAFSSVVFRASQSKDLFQMSWLLEFYISPNKINL